MVEAGSIHRADGRPQGSSWRGGRRGEDPRGVIALDVAATVLAEIRRKKSEAKRPMKKRPPRAGWSCASRADRIALLEDVRVDIMAAGLIERRENRPLVISR